MKIAQASKPFSLRRSLSEPGSLTLPGLKLRSRLAVQMRDERWTDGFGSVRTLDQIGRAHV